MTSVFKMTILALLLSSCLGGKNGGGDGKEKSQQSLTPNKADLQGSYSSGCVEAEDGSYQDVFVFTDQALEITVENYSGPGCVAGKEIERFRSTYDFEFSGTQLTLMKKRYFYTLFDQSHLTELNANAGFCGFTNWAEQVERDITGRSCDDEVFRAGDKFNVAAHLDGSDFILKDNRYTRHP